MEQITIYHNPRCSKSRKALELIESRGLDPCIVEYLKSPLSLEQLRSLRTYFELKDFVRTDEPLFKELGLSLEHEDELLKAMVKAPILVQRPIVIFKNKAIIGRPPELVFDLLQR